jgi:hypothetical protein
LKSYNIASPGTAAVATSSGTGYLAAGSEAIAPANDGWGPYKPILAIFDDGKEMIPGKLCTSKG